MKITFTLESVTPMFLGGVAQQPEPRSASVRGALRYWFRAGLGGAFGDTNEDIANLAFHEKCVFGNTDAGSSIVVRFIPQHAPKVSRPLQPHKQGVMRADAFQETSTFKLTLSLSPQAARQKDAQAKFELAIWSALLWLTLGGIGRRARRGAGSLRICQTEFNHNELTAALVTCLQLWDKKDRANNKNELGGKIKATVDTALETFNQLAMAHSYPAADFNNPPSIATLKDDTRILIWTPNSIQKGDCTNALSVLMNKMSQTKHELKKKQIDFEYAFGGINLKIDKSDAKEPKKRRASPLHVTVHQLTNGWALVFTFLYAKILASGDDNLGEVDIFLDRLEQAFEVTLEEGEN